MNSEKKQFLIVIPGGIGNAIMFSPAFESLKAQFPDSEFSLLTSDMSAEKVYARNNLKKIFIYRRGNKSDFIKIFFKILFFYNFDYYITGMGINSLKAGLMGIASKASVRLGENIFAATSVIAADTNIHEVERNLKIIESIVEKKNIVNSLSFCYNENDKREASECFQTNGLNILSPKFIGAHIGSNNFLTAKRWPLENFKILFELIHKKYPEYSIIFFGGKNEIEYSDSLIKGNYTFNFVGKLSIHATAAAIEKCSVFISNDSGLMHIAAAVNIPVIAIFGPTIISKNRPYSVKSRVISKDYDCQPCYKYNMPISCADNFKCMKDITPEEILEALTNFI